MKFIDYFKGAFITTYNIILNALTFGRFVWLEGRVRNYIFRNWARRFRYRPKNFVQPASEKKIVELVKNSKSIRVLGSGHSFNGGIGAVGIIVELVLQGVDRFNVEQKVEISDLSYVESNLERLLQENEHFSLYLFPFTEKCQINTWNR